MAFAAARADSNSMAEINITPLVDVMLVLLVIFIVTAPLLDQRLELTLPQSTPARPLTPETVLLRVDRGDLFRLEGQAAAPRELQQRLLALREAHPDLVVKIEVDPDADYQSAATAMALVRRAGIEHLGLVEP